jgi:UDP-galactopyranose mutase
MDILLAGRYSEWEYYNADYAFVAGRKAAQAVRARVAPARVQVAAGGISVSHS